MTPPPLFLGIDIGTSGVRAIAVDAQGRIAAQASADLDLPPDAARGNTHEQPPAAWLACFNAVLAQLGDLGRIAAIAIDGTSGTVVPVDADGRAVGNAIMYNDSRSSNQAAHVSNIAGQTFTASHAISKIAWLAAHKPDDFARTTKFISQSDYLAGQLTGRFDVTDYSNALKTGYDLTHEAWPDWTEKLPGVRERLPTVVAPGSVTGHTSAGIPVIAGCTDGTAGFLASGAANVGDYNTTLGTTLVFKGISRKRHEHPDGLIYSHKLPGGAWLPGAASSTGGEWISAKFPNADLVALDRAAILPTDTIAYPLIGRGERFPFRRAEAQGFCEPPATGASLFAANLQGVAFLERLGYEVLDGILGTSSGGGVYATGGGSRSDLWMQCRADVTSRVVHRPACPQAAFGMAILAAVGCNAFTDLWSAISAMVRIERCFKPRDDQYIKPYEAFIEHCRKRGYL